MAIEYSLWVKQIATDGKTQVVPRQPLVLTYLSFSPDGEYIYFTRGTPRRGGFVLSRVPAIGGLATPILDDVDTPISFSPDGREFVFMRGAGPETHIVVAAAGGGSQRILATRKSPLAFSFFAPDWSPDGKSSGGVRDRSEQRLAVDRSSPGGRRQQPRTLHQRQSPRPCPLAARRIRAADGRLGRAGASPAEFGRLSGGSIWRIGVPERSSRTTDVRSGRPRPLLPGHRGERQRRSLASSIRSCRTSGLRRPTTWMRPDRSPGANPLSRVTAGYRTTTRSCIAI